MSKNFVQTPEMKQLLMATVHPDWNVASQAKAKLANLLVAALTTPLKQGVMPGDNVSGIFAEEEFGPGVAPEYPLDFLTPGSEKNFVAYTIPNTGALPERHVEGSYLMVPTFEIGTSIDWSRKYARDARWPIVGRAMGVAQSALQRKKNNDGWHTILSAIVDRGLAVYDDAATAGLFTKRLVSLGKTVMRRNSGGNSTSVNQGKLTHIAISPEGLEDIRSWDLTQVDDVTRRQIFLAGEGEMSLTKIFGVTLMDLDELGVGQEYQKYFTNTLATSIGGSKLELAVGLDLSSNDSFVRPYRLQPGGQRIEMQPRVTLIEQNREGYFWREENGWSVLDNRRVIALYF